MSAMQRVKTWSDGKKWLMWLVGSIILVFIAFVASGANDGRQALKKTCDLGEADKILHIKTSKNTEKIYTLDKEVAKNLERIDTNLEWIRKTLEDMQKKIHEPVP